MLIKINKFSIDNDHYKYKDGLIQMNRLNTYEQYNVTATVRQVGPDLNLERNRLSNPFSTFLD